MPSKTRKATPTEGGSTTTDGTVTAPVSQPHTGRGAVANSQFSALMHNNAQDIVAGLIHAAAHAGDEQYWQRIDRYQSLAGSISSFCGLGSSRHGRWRAPPA